VLSLDENIGAGSASGIKWGRDPEADLLLMRAGGSNVGKAIV